MATKYQQDLGEQLKKYQPLVRRIASQIGSRLPANVMLDDLIQEGMTGLLDALQRYVPQPNQSFESYASMRIRGAIYDACRKEDILPRNQRDKLDGLEKVTQRLEQTLGRLPSEQEIAKAAGLDVNDYYQVLDSLFNVLPIDDVPENLYSLEKMLAAKDRKFLKATSGKEALKLAFSNDVSLILLDVQMPEMNGFEVAEILKSNKRTAGISILFVILLSL